MRTPKYRYMIQHFSHGQWLDDQEFTVEKQAFKNLNALRNVWPDIIYRLVKFEMVKIYNL